MIPDEPVQNEPEHSSQAPQDSQAPLGELQTLIDELKQKVTGLREGEPDAAELEQRLRELGDLASRASSALDAAAR